MKPKPTPAEWLVWHAAFRDVAECPPRDLPMDWFGKEASDLLLAAKAILEDIANTHPPLRTER